MQNAGGIDINLRSSFYPSSQLKVINNRSTNGIIGGVNRCNNCKIDGEYILSGNIPNNSN